MTNNPRPFDRLAAGIGEALAAHGVPPRPKSRADQDDRGARFAAQSRHAREGVDLDAIGDALNNRRPNRTR